MIVIGFLYTGPNPKPNFNLQRMELLVEQIRRLLKIDPNQQVWVWLMTSALGSFGAKVVKNASEEWDGIYEDVVNDSLQQSIVLHCMK